MLRNLLTLHTAQNKSTEQKNGICELKWKPVSLRKT